MGCPLVSHSNPTLPPASHGRLGVGGAREPGGRLRRARGENAGPEAEAPRRSPVPERDRRPRRGRGDDAGGGGGAAGRAEGDGRVRRGRPLSHAAAAPEERRRAGVGEVGARPCLLPEGRTERPAPARRRSPHQIAFHDSFTRACARVIWKEDWASQRPRIMQKMGWEKCPSEVLVSTPRRFGKTFSCARSPFLLLPDQPRTSPGPAPDQPRTSPGPSQDRDLRGLHVACLRRRRRRLLPRAAARTTRPRFALARLLPTPPRRPQARRASRKLLERIVECEARVEAPRLPAANTADARFGHAMAGSCES